MSRNVDVQFTDPRPSVEIHLPDGRVLRGPRGAQVGDFFKAIENESHPPIVGAVVNGELRELTYQLEMDARARPVTMGEADGMRIYRRSLTFLLEAGFSQLFPDAVLHIDHSVASGGYYCQVRGRQPLTPEELKQVEEQMWALVEADLPFIRTEVPLTEAINYFVESGADDKVRLLAHRKKDYLTLYQLNGHYDYHHGYMVPSTGYLRWFALTPIEGGFTLRFPRRHRPTTLLPPPEYPKLLATFRQYGNWLDRLGISSVGALNDAIQEGRVLEVILVAEALHEQRVAEIAAQIADQREKIRVILIAGPSSSGKTSFAKRLSVQLLTRGVSPFPLEMDNYFLDRDKTPRDENGHFDFETINALDRKRLGSDLLRLIQGEMVQMPRFDFVSGKSIPGDTIQLNEGEMVILEGIHGLNPELLTDIPPEQTFRIYTSALTQLNLDRHNRISTTDTRLLRRIVRDARERGYSAYQTIQRWESVRRGEKRNIFPYQENADVMFNSALAYELAVLKPLAEPLLRQVPYGPLESDLIPDNSILREFTGGSILRQFKLWKNHA